MYRAPDTSAFRDGDTVSVTDILAADVTLQAAYAELPLDMRHGRDDLDAALPWRPRAAVLRELHRQRAAEVVASRPCAACTEPLVPELLTQVEHPYDPELTVTLLDAVLELSGVMFEVAAQSGTLASMVDRFCGSTQVRQVCTAPGCGETAQGEATTPPAFCITVLGLLATWSYETGLSRDMEPAIDAAWTEVLKELYAAPSSLALTPEQILELACHDPRVVHAETHIPQRWADSDWGALARSRAETPTLSELRIEQGVSVEHMAHCVLLVANWLADEVDRTLVG